ncbi:MAG: molecular chaperone DnaJ [Hyphomicrobiales bacterium]|nr:molecular chaperone DnaJ [Hyphomicrobiales bacterium]
MAEQSYYETLGVARDADEQAIKSAYRNLAKKYHPDQNPGNAGAEQQFKDINEAYEVLKDKQARAAYDSLGHAAFKAHGSGGGAGMHPGAEGFAGFGGFARGGGGFSDVFSDIFDDILGGGGQTRRGAGSRRGEDLRYDLTVTLEEAFAGKKTEISVVAPVACTTCAGSGAAPGTKPVTCSACGGAGRIRATRGFFTVEQGCAQCQGRGERIETPCSQCKGAGRVRSRRNISVDIPAGIDEGTRIRLSGEGAPSASGGGNGDLYIFMSVSEHPLFQRDGANLYCQVPIPMTTAALGGELEIPALGGQRLKIKIPEGCQSGHRLRLRSKGMPVLHSRDHGDLYVEVAVETPVGLSHKQKELLNEFAKQSDTATNPRAHGFFKRVKGLFEGL